MDSIQSLNDQYWMRRALKLAREAAAQGEIPVGAVVVRDHEIVAEAYNRKEMDHNSLAHAEILALEEASRRLGRWRLTGCTLYVTLEPCVMCAGAIVQSRVDRVVYGAVDPKAGAVQSLYKVLEDSRLNHSPALTTGVLEPECSEVLKTFFRELREKKAAGAKPGLPEAAP